jgi:hypothetical protein
LSLPKLGPIKLAEALPRIAGEEPDRALIAKPDMVTLSRDAAGCYFVSFSTEVEIEALPATGRAGAPVYVHGHLQAGTAEQYLSWTATCEQQDLLVLRSRAR